MKRPLSVCKLRFNPRDRHNWGVVCDCVSTASGQGDSMGLFSSNKVNYDDAVAVMKEIVKQDRIARKALMVAMPLDPENPRVAYEIHCRQEVSDEEWAQYKHAWERNWDEVKELADIYSNITDALKAKYEAYLEANDEPETESAGEGEARGNISRALRSLGVQLPHEPDDTQYCIKAASELVRVIMDRACPNGPGSDQRFVGGIFAFVASNHITRLVGAPFETVSSIVPIALFGPDYASALNELIDSYNQMTQEKSKVVEAIGQNIAKFINAPSDEQIRKLADLFNVCDSGVVNQ